MATLEDILRIEVELEELAKAIASERDVVRIQELARRLQQGANQILEMGRTLDQKLAPERDCGRRTSFTKAEREQVARSTGVALEALFLENIEKWIARMPHISVATIERLAMTSVAECTFRVARRRQAAAILKELESIEDPLPETQSAIDEFKRENL